jgi:sortase A
MSLAAERTHSRPGGTPGQAAPGRVPGGRGRLGSLLLAAGLVLALATAADVASGVAQQQQLDQAWRQWRQTHIVPAHPQPPDPAWLHPVDGVDFDLAVPKLGYAAAVGEGVSAPSLAAGPGHYPAMAWPGQPGNVGVAAHNGYWLHFDQLQPGDLVLLQTRWGDFRYRVVGRRVVWPSDRSVLVATPDDRLTLTTCWPLWAGAFARQRLVITAIQVWPAPAQAAVAAPAGSGATPGGGDQPGSLLAIAGAGLLATGGALFLKRGYLSRY